MWYDRAIRSAVDAAGCVVIPKALRERLGLGRRRPVEIRERDGRTNRSRPPQDRAEAAFDDLIATGREPG